MLRRLTDADERLNSFRYYNLLVPIFVAILLISNLVAGKICAIPLGTWGGREIVANISGAQLLFPLTYIFGDIFTEVYGYGASRRAIWLGFFSSTILVGMSLFVVWVPPAPDWPHQHAFEVVFGMVPRIIVASLAAYWLGEFANSFVLAKMKIWTNGRWLWTRTIGSTAVGQFVDTAVVILIIFAGTTSWSTMLNLIVSGYVGKVLYETAATPVTYLVVNRLKRAEGVDVYDRETDFNPFARNKAPAGAAPPAPSAG